MCGPKALPWLSIVVNRNLCIDFYKAFFNFWHILLSSCTYCYVCCALRSDKLKLEFQCWEAENGEVAAQQILARVAVRVCMCVPIDENNVRVACCGACSWPRSADYELSSRAYFKAGAMPAISHDFRAREGGLKYRNLAKGLRPIVAFVRASRKRFLFGGTSFKGRRHVTNHCIRVGQRTSSIQESELKGEW